MVKTLLCCIALFWQAPALLAQVLTPLALDPARADGTSCTYSIQGAQQTQDQFLQLPFFDDFARASGAPDPSRWQPGGGVLVSNRYAANPVTRNAATFDGLRGNGQPYGGGIPVGPTDTLTSLPIRLGALSPADSLYLSYFWQAGGLGDAPNFSSAGNFFLRLEFKRADGQWVQVWQQLGQGRSTPFEQVMLSLRDPAYFHDDFAFRFVSAGGRGGGVDLWHLDYVLLDRNRRRTQTHTRDVALRTGLNSLLRRYTAMPLSQFLRDPAGELAPAVETRLTNRNKVPAAISWRGVLRNLTTGAPADTFLRGNAVIPALDQQYLVRGQVPPTAISGGGPALRLRQTIFLTTSEPDARLRYNDTVSRVTELADYFAYDDGTAETGFSYNATGATRVAYRFVLNQSDQVVAFRLYFTRTNNPGTTLTFHVWPDEGGRPADQPTYSQTFRIPEANQLDAFLEVMLSERVPVAGTFYVGWSQPAGVSFVNVGFDLNETAVSQIFGWTAVANWVPVPLERGALLFRPVMGRTVTGTLPGADLPQLSVSPNPSNGQVRVRGAYDAVTVYNGAGRLVADLPGSADGELDLRHLPPGLYLLRFVSRGGREAVRKLVITR